MIVRKSLIVIAILALAGVAVSAYALWQHYAPLGSGFCNLSETFSCDLVNQSAFSDVFGIPVAGIGIVGYGLLFALALGALFDPSFAPRILPWALVAALAGFGFSAYLTYIELFVIGAACVLCVTSQTLILVITGVTGVAYRSARRDAGVVVSP